MLDRRTPVFPVEPNPEAAEPEPRNLRYIVDRWGRGATSATPPQPTCGTEALREHRRTPSHWEGKEDGIHEDSGVSTARTPYATLPAAQFTSRYQRDPGSIYRLTRRLVHVKEERWSKLVV